VPRSPFSFPSGEAIVRALPLILLLVACAGGLLFLVLQQDTDAGAGGGADLSAGDEVRSEPPATAAEPMTSVVEVVPEGQWDDSLDKEGEGSILADRRVMRAKDIVEDASGEMWQPTGERVLALLERELKGIMKVRFRDAAALADFRASVWRDKHPGHVPLCLILEACHEVGFRPVMRPEGVYLLRIEKP